MTGQGEAPENDAGSGATGALVWTAASVEKAGMRPEENEDAWHVAPGPGGSLTLAVSDGATESAFARAWARTLGACAVDRASGGSGDGPLTDERARSMIAEALVRAQALHAAMLDARRAALPWYAAEKAEAGAHAALVVVTVGASGDYRAEAVGDACLFEIDAAGRRVMAWPLDTPEAFAARPVLLASTGAAPAARGRAGRIPTGGALLVCTDALAAHLLAHPGTPWPAPGDPAAAVAAARAAGMRNDDVAWVRVARATGSGLRTCQA